MLDYSLISFVVSKPRLMSRRALYMDVGKN